MRKILPRGLCLGLGTTATLVACFADISRGENPPAPPFITPAVDDATLKRAAAKGEALLASPKWQADVSIGSANLGLVGPALLCWGIVRTPAPAPAPAGRPGGFVGGAPRAAGAGGLPGSKTAVLDAQTGKPFWEMNQRISMPITWQMGDQAAWSEKGLLSFGVGDGQLKMMRYSADTPEGASVWETTYAAPQNPGRGAGAAGVRLMPIMAEPQIIAGEQYVAGARGGGGSGGRGDPGGPESAASKLTIRSFDRKTGHVQWETPVPVLAVSALVTRVAQGRVYGVVTETPSGAGGPGKGFVMGLQASDGKVLWKSESGVIAQGAEAQGSMLYALLENGESVAYDGATGKEKWRTALSVDCDPAKSKLQGRGAFTVDNDTLYAYVTNYSLDTSMPQAAAKEAEEKADRGIAVLDVHTGKQTGYFNLKGVFLPRNNWVGHLQVHGNTLLVQVINKGCMAIDRKTLQLQWSIFLNSSLTPMADGMVYVSTTPPTLSTTTHIVAVDLDVPR